MKLLHIFKYYTIKLLNIFKSKTKISKTKNVCCCSYRCSRRDSYDDHIDYALSKEIANIDYTSNINTFYKDLYDCISKDNYSNSYKDYKYTHILPSNDLYKALSEYTPNCKLISDFNSMYDGKYCIKYIKDIYISERHIQTSPRGVSEVGLYNMGFTVYYMNKTV